MFPHFVFFVLIIAWLESLFTQAHTKAHTLGLIWPITRLFCLILNLICVAHALNRPHTEDGAPDFHVVSQQTQQLVLFQKNIITVLSSVKMYHFGRQSGRKSVERGRQIIC